MTIEKLIAELEKYPRDTEIWICDRKSKFQNRQILIVEATNACDADLDLRMIRDQYITLEKQDFVNDEAYNDAILNCGKKDYTIAHVEPESVLLTKQIILITS